MGSAIFETCKETQAILSRVRLVHVFKRYGCGRLRPLCPPSRTTTPRCWLSITNPPSTRKTTQPPPRSPGYPTNSRNTRNPALGRHLTVLPPRIPRPPILGPRFNFISASYRTNSSSEPQPSPNIHPRPPHLDQHIRLPPPHRRQDLLLRPTAILPHLGSPIRSHPKSDSNLWPQR